MTKTEREHVIRVARLGCIACKKFGQTTREVDMHQVVMENSLGRHLDPFSVIPLCTSHRVSLGESKRTWEAKYGTESELLEQVRGLIG